MSGRRLCKHGWFLWLSWSKSGQFVVRLFSCCPPSLKLCCMEVKSAQWGGPLWQDETWMSAVTQASTEWNCISVFVTQWTIGVSAINGWCKCVVASPDRERGGKLIFTISETLPGGNSVSCNYRSKVSLPALSSLCWHLAIRLITLSFAADLS